MYQCRLCLWSVTLDDVVVELRGERCICLRCFLRETDTTKPIPIHLFRELRALLAGA